MPFIIRVLPHLIPPVADEGLTLSFAASADHSATDPITGDPLVTGYELWVFAWPTDELIDTEALGKPSPVGGIITVTNSPLLDSLAAGTYFVRVVTLGPHEVVSPDQVAQSVPITLTV